jgi:hypothetical protein
MVSFLCQLFVLEEVLVVVVIHQEIQVVVRLDIKII